MEPEFEERGVGGWNPSSRSEGWAPAGCRAAPAARPLVAGLQRSWGACAPLSRSGACSSDPVGLSWALKWVRDGRTALGTPWSCRKAPFPVWPFGPSPWTTEALRPLGTLPARCHVTAGNWGLDKSSDFLQDQQLARSGDGTCPAISTPDPLPGPQCGDRRRGREQANQDCLGKQTCRSRTQTKACSLCFFLSIQANYLRYRDGDLTCMDYVALISKSVT